MGLTFWTGSCACKKKFEEEEEKRKRKRKIARWMKTSKERGCATFSFQFFP